jgi:hypothetical protein
VRYDAINAMLLNEFLKEHRKNERQEATIADLKAEIVTLFATVKQQAGQIQKVNAFLERANVHRAWPRTNNRPGTACPVFELAHGVLRS